MNECNKIIPLSGYSTRELIDALMKRLDQGFYGNCKKEFNALAERIKELEDGR